MKVKDSIEYIDTETNLNGVILNDMVRASVNDVCLQLKDKFGDRLNEVEFEFVGKVMEPAPNVSIDVLSCDDESLKKELDDFLNN